MHAWERFQHPANKLDVFGLKCQRVRRFLQQVFPVTVRAVVVVILIKDTFVFGLLQVITQLAKLVVSQLVHRSEIFFARRMIGEYRRHQSVKVNCVTTSHLYLVIISQFRSEMCQQS